MRGALAQVPSQKCNSLGCFCHHTIYMFVPCEVVSQVYNEILSTTSSVCPWSLNVAGLPLKALVEVNSGDLTTSSAALTPILLARLDPLAISWRHHLF